MCGIVGYIGTCQAAPVLTDCQSWSTADTIRPELLYTMETKFRCRKQWAV